MGIKKTFLALFFFSFLIQGVFASVQDELNKIPYEDRFFLKAFFRNFFMHDSLGYVLFFDTKPACLTSFSMNPSRQHFLEKQMAKGWEVWKKYEPLFPHPNFIFIEEVSCERNAVRILVINKRALRKCFEEHELYFKEVLGDHFTSANDLLERIEQEKKLNWLTEKDECLLGLILGFGFESSKAFKEQNLTQECPKWTEHYCSIGIQEPKKCLIFPIGFMGDPHSKQVQDLQNVYQKELEQLWIKYKCTRNTLQLVLEQLSQV